MNATTSPLPLVVQLGFAGSRHLLDKDANPDVDETAFLLSVEKHLTQRLRSLRDPGGELRLRPHHRLCGISQIAIGADTLFTRACATLGIPQRILLPQNRDEYLNAVNSRGDRDFSDAQRDEAIRLLASPHVVHERVVSDAPNRHARFEDVNLEIVRVSDLVVCLVRAESDGRPGGTHDVIALAAARKRPVLIISVDVKNGQAVFSESWEWNAPAGKSPAEQLESMKPTLPRELAGVTSEVFGQSGPLPSATEYLGVVKETARRQAARLKTLFKSAALVVILMHVMATICAAIALALKKHPLLPALLALELVLLAIGFSRHRLLRRAEVSRAWAMSRLLAELAYSVLAVGQLHVYLDYLFSLPIPDSLRPLLRTINVLHLQETRSFNRSTWSSVRDGYVEDRLVGRRGQIPFYKRESGKAQRQLWWAHRTFVVCAVLAMIATVIKLALCWEEAPTPSAVASGAIGVLAVILPVLAVGALSLAAALDLEARYHTFREMHEYLVTQERHLRDARSEREFSRLVLETESRLLGETVNWFSRRSYTGVA